MNCLPPVTPDLSPEAISLIDPTSKYYKPLGCSDSDWSRCLDLLGHEFDRVFRDTLRTSPMDMFNVPETAQEEFLSCLASNVVALQCMRDWANESDHYNSESTHKKALYRMADFYGWLAATEVKLKQDRYKQQLRGMSHE